MVWKVFVGVLSVLKTLLLLSGLIYGVGYLITLLWKYFLLSFPWRGWMGTVCPHGEDGGARASVGRTSDSRTGASGRVDGAHRARWGRDGA